MQDDFIIKKYKFTNTNNIDLNIDFLVRSKLMSSEENQISARIFDDSLLQYNHDYTIGIFAKDKIMNYQIHEINQTIASGVIGGKDYIGMTSDSGISYGIGKLKPGESKIFTLFIFIKKNKEGESQEEIQKKIEKIRKLDIEKKLQEINRYWKKYVQEHMKFNIKDIGNNAKKIYIRSILLFPLLTNMKTGAIIAAPEIDENKKYCGRLFILLAKR